MRLIDADSIKPCDFPSTDMDGLDVVNFLNTLPTIEAEPVRHGCGHCKDGTYHGQVLMLCNDNMIRRIEYCPSCGAKMDGRKSQGGATSSDGFAATFPSRGRLERKENPKD